ncbi:hypothetical protein D8B34_22980 [Verminephrobacter eiseniae]|nr:hypothetical protein [Verminephrobacter eiseniae]MCW5261880.1 hypothetical protein [Verminephrobacter eiseniae]MCW5294686.1 hypothetical protein [Verminephrobacter eiseniae]MCW8225577.1 hypothetical protein [Verminephrobacter eiseniae]MCW8236474.1 hypothetical protein [Verminephrobacter eiseniae]
MHFVGVACHTSVLSALRLRVHERCGNGMKAAIAATRSSRHRSENPAGLGQRCPAPGEIRPALARESLDRLVMVLPSATALPAPSTPSAAGSAGSGNRPLPAASVETVDADRMRADLHFAGRRRRCLDRRAAQLPDATASVDA